MGAYEIKIDDCLCAWARRLVFLSLIKYAAPLQDMEV